MTIVRTCAACCGRFEISDDEQAHLARLAVELGRPMVIPRRCYPCRRAARQAKYETPADARTDNEWLVCVECGSAYIFGGRDRAYWIRHGWATPKRCRPCRVARASGRS